MHLKKVVKFTASLGDVKSAQEDLKNLIEEVNALNSTITWTYTVHKIQDSSYVMLMSTVFRERKCSKELHQLHQTEGPIRVTYHEHMALPWPTRESRSCGLCRGRTCS